MPPALDPQQLIGDVLRLGTIHSVDRAGARCRVAIGDILTGPIPWLAGAAGDTRIWSPPTVGEQVLLLCPEGDLLAAVAVPGLWSDTFPAPAGDARVLIRFADDAVIAYDPAAHALSAILPAGGTAVVTAPGGMTINGPLTVKGASKFVGDVDVQGTATVSDDVVGGGKSLKSHKHLGVQPGGGVSGAPQ